MGDEKIPLAVANFHGALLVLAWVNGLRPVWRASPRNFGHGLSACNGTSLLTLVTTSAASQPLAVDVRGTKLNLSLVKPPFVPLKKVS